MTLAGRKFACGASAKVHSPQMRHPRPRSAMSGSRHRTLPRTWALPGMRPEPKFRSVPLSAEPLARFASPVSPAPRGPAPEAPMNAPRPGPQRDRRDAQRQAGVGLRPRRAAFGYSALTGVWRRVVLDACRQGRTPRPNLRWKPACFRAVTPRAGLTPALLP
jgi:hypothetical protein